MVGAYSVQIAPANVFISYGGPTYMYSCTLWIFINVARDHERVSRFPIEFLHVKIA